ncbi:MAG: phospho-N-acetylmuramoyl-pentapeptide-transferase [Candidatus Borkfalkiaceae bacterium]|nr:phospho-N-acetylmuramoyl-pentapeptide-transferase [bacterium]MDY2851230.1 phospho-N-acetylmuramoyl-pentapeptide-transferase [Christensenellaceae bacterium]
MKVYILAFLLSFVVSAVLCFLFLPLLKRLKAGQSILSYVKEHKYKGGTPTMGGIFFVAASVFVSLLLSSRVDLRPMLVSVAAGLGFCLVGFLDDFIKIRHKRNEGLTPFQKIVFQTLIATLSAVFAYSRGFTCPYVPFFRTRIELGWLSVPLNVFVFIAVTNCVNLTDGLDGLAAGTSYVYLLILAFIVLAEEEFSGATTNNYALLSFCLSGALIGFLLFNTYRAKVFMGDTGSLALGGFISCLSVFSSNTFYIPIVGIVFVLSGISVIVQVIYYKRTGKRFFLMAPVHHHFQMKGASESKIAFCYKAVTLIAGLLCILRLI